MMSGISTRNLEKIIQCVVKPPALAVGSVNRKG